MARRRNKPPVPTRLPGEFALVEWNPDRERYYVTLDDPDHSSYDIGSEFYRIKRLFFAWGLEPVWERVIDTAREYRRAIVVFGDEPRVSSVVGTPPKRVLDFGDEDGEVTHGLPVLGRRWR